MLDRYMSQTPQEDGAFLYTQFMQVSNPEAETYYPSPTIRISKIQKQITQFDKAHLDGNESPGSPCLYSFAGCEFRCSRKSSWVDHIQRCHLQLSQCGQSPDSAHPSAKIPSHLLFKTCLVHGCSNQFRAHDGLEERLGHLYTHVEQDNSSRISKAIESHAEFLKWSSRPDIGIIQKSAGRWTSCKCHEGSLESFRTMVLPPSPQSPSPKYGSDYAFSHSSLARDEIFSRKSLPTAGTDSISSVSDSANSQNSPDVEQLSRSDLLDELAHFTISWFSKWLANQPGKTELNPGTRSTQNCSGGSQSEPSQPGKRKARGQRDKDRGDWKARRVNRTNGDEPNDNDGNVDAPIANCAQPELDTRKRLACPFHKRYPLSYGHGKFELCATGSWKTYHRVREHLNRKHLRPAHLCGRCFADFRDEASLQRHSPLQCTAIENNPYMNPTEWELLKAASMRGMQEDEKWKHMYHLLFPGEDIPNPYKDEPACNEHVTRLCSRIERILLTTPDGVPNPLETIQSIMSVVIEGVFSASGTARDVADLCVAAADALNEPSGLLQGTAYMTDLVQDQTGAGFFDSLGGFPTARFGDDQLAFGLFAESENPPDAMNGHASYQNRSYAFNGLQIDLNTAGQLDDQFAPGTVDEGGQDPDMTDVAWIQNGSEESSEGTDEGGQYQDMTDVAWTQKGSEESPEGTDDAEHQDDAWGDQESR